MKCETDSSSAERKVVNGLCLQKSDGMGGGSRAERDASDGRAFVAPLFYAL